LEITYTSYNKLLIGDNIHIVLVHDAWDVSEEDEKEEDPKLVPAPRSKMNEIKKTNGIHKMRLETTREAQTFPKTVTPEPESMSAPPALPHT
jgi:hypothetical protein